MWAADFVGTHTTEHLQSLILLGVFMVRIAYAVCVWCGMVLVSTTDEQNNRDRGEAVWALLGAAIKVSDMYQALPISLHPAGRHTRITADPSDGARSRPFPTRRGATGCRWQATSHVDGQVGELDPARSRAAGRVEPRVFGLGVGAEL
jgi:hypothetical protein